MEKLFYLGPKGTYTELAALKMCEITKEKYILTPVSTIAKVTDSVFKTPDSLGVLPIENAIEGIVRQSIDSIYSNDVKINAQVDVKIEHCLISKGKKENIKNLVSHPQALAQCQKYILENFDENINLITKDSTAASVRFILNENETFGAIASKQCVSGTNLNIIDENIGDIKENKTRFVLISKRDLKLFKNSRTSIVFNTKNEPGALLKILSIINKYNLNLVYLESRPSKKVFGEYNFFADIDRGVEEIQEALLEIDQECNYYKLLGSYPVF